MANTHKTKAEMLQELESIKGLLLEEDNIPVLQEIEQEIEQEIADDQHEELLDFSDTPDHSQSPFFNRPTQHFTEYQESLFPDFHEKAVPSSVKTNASVDNNYTSRFAQPTMQPPARPLAKASGENPFLPQHIRERLHGNNPPPLFEYETAKKIINATKNIEHKINKPRQHLVDEILTGMMPQIERELRHRLFAMSIEELQKLLDSDE